MRKEEETDEKNVIHEEKIEFEDEIPMGYERIDMDYEAVEEEEEEKSTSSFDTSIADAQLRMLEDDYARCLAMSNVSKQASTMMASFESASEQSTSTTTKTSIVETTSSSYIILILIILSIVKSLCSRGITCRTVLQDGRLRRCKWYDHVSC